METKEEIFKKLCDFVPKIVRKFLSNEADIEDASQDALMCIFKKWDQFCSKSKIETWAYHIAYNAAMIIYRKQKQNVEYCNMEKFCDYRCVSDSLLIEEYKRKINESLRTIPKDQKEIFVLIDINGISIEEAAKIMKINKMNFKSKLHRARKKIKQSLSNYWEDKS